MASVSQPPSSLPVRGSSAWKRHASFWAMFVTGGALIATDEISQVGEAHSYVFEQTVVGPAFEVSEETPSVAFRIRIQALTLSPDATPFTGDIGLLVQGDLTHTGTPEEARWTQARLQAIAVPQRPEVGGGTGAMDAGQSAAPLGSSSAVDKVFTRFEVSLSQLAFHGDCAELAATPPCEAVVLLSVASGGGAETVNVQWKVHISGRADRTDEGDMTTRVDSAVAVSVEQL